MQTTVITTYIMYGIKPCAFLQAMCSLTIDTLQLPPSKDLTVQPAYALYSVAAPYSLFRMSSSFFNTSPTVRSSSSAIARCLSADSCMKGASPGSGMRFTTGYVLVLSKVNDGVAQLL